MTTSPPTVGVAAAREARATVLGLVEARIRGLITEERARWAAVDVRAGSLVDAVGGLVEAGGKRLRPTFCVSGFLAAGGRQEDPGIVGPAAALELLHVLALIHDDVLDDSALRRGVPTAHVRHAAEHEARGWHGESRRFGEGIAILAGDLAHVYANRLAAEAPDPARKIWAELSIEMCVGQFLDIVIAAECDTDPRLASWIAVSKSGRYTIQRPLLLGATIAGRPELAGPFGDYGLALGEAFQLRDDLIDAFGDGAVTGKPVGLDFAQQKVTLLIALAMQRDERVRAIVSAGPDNAAGWDAVALRAALTDSGVRADVERRIDRLVDRACVAITRAPLDDAWRSELADMASRVAYRDR